MDDNIRKEKWWLNKGGMKKGRRKMRFDENSEYDGKVKKLSDLLQEDWKDDAEEEFTLFQYKD